MERPPLSLALTSVLAARVDGDRRGLLQSMRPSTLRPTGPGDAALLPAPHLTLVPRPLATVTPLPRVIPWPRQPQDAADRQPDPAA